MRATDPPTQQAEAVRVDSTVQAQTDTIRLALRAGGGFLGRFTRASK